MSRQKGCIIMTMVQCDSFTHPTSSVPFLSCSHRVSRLVQCCNPCSWTPRPLAAHRAQFANDQVHPLGSGKLNARLAVNAAFAYKLASLLANILPSCIGNPKHPCSSSDTLSQGPEVSRANQTDIMRIDRPHVRMHARHRKTD